MLVPFVFQIPIDMNFAAALADRAILLDEGCVIDDGDAKKIMSDSKLMTEHGLEVPNQLKGSNYRSLGN